MDLSAVNVNATVDDFDSILVYNDQSVWETPDPSSSTFNAQGSPWLMGTFHKTDTVGATLSLNFTGPAVFVYGHSGPSYGSYEVKIDSSSSTISAYSPNNSSTPFLLYGANNLTYAFHTLTLRNLGAKGGDRGGNTFLLDFIQTTMQVAPPGATVSNVTYQENDTALTYSGTWHSNTSPAFSGGGTSFTNEDKASVSLSFHGSAIYMFGDKKNDHGLYSVILDSRPAEIYSGISGCGGAFGMTCEQQQPTLQYLMHNLDDSLHTIKIENIAGVNQSFFDFDSIVVTVPSTYTVRQLSNDTSSPFATTSLISSTTSANDASQTSRTSNSNGASAMALWDPIFLVIFSMAWLLCSKLHH